MRWGSCSRGPLLPSFEIVRQQTTSTKHSIGTAQLLRRRLHDLSSHEKPIPISYNNNSSGLRPRRPPTYPQVASTGASQWTKPHDTATSSEGSLESCAESSIIRRSRRTRPTDFQQLGATIDQTVQTTIVKSRRELRRARREATTQRDQLRLKAWLKKRRQVVRLQEVRVTSSLKSRLHRTRGKAAKAQQQAIRTL